MALEVRGIIIFDKIISVILTTVFIFIVLFLAFRYTSVLRIPHINPWYSPAAYTLKVLVGFYFLYIYTEVYGNGSLSADAGAFMSESAILSDVFSTSPSDYFKLLIGVGNQEELVATYLRETSHWDTGAQAIISDNRNILRVHSLIQFISRGETAIHVLIMCMISTLGLKHIFITMKERSQLNLTVLFIALLLLPSVLFWTSSILKEPLMILGFGLFARGTIGLSTGFKKWFYLTIGASLLLAFKPYVLICLLPALFFYFMYKIAPKHKLISGLTAILLITIGAATLFPSARLKVVEMLSRKQYDFKNVGKGGLHAQSDSCFYFFQPDQIQELKIEGDSVSITKPMEVHQLNFGSIDDPIPTTLTPSGEKWAIYFRNDKSDGYIELTMIHNSFSTLIKNIPQAIINSLFRPMPSDPGSWLKYPSMIETLLLYAFLIYALYHKRKLKTEEVGYIFAILIFVLCLGLIIGWVTPVLGAIVRYRIPAFLGLLIIGLLIIKPSKLFGRE